MDNPTAGITRDQAVTEAARCLMCHNAPCEQACPANVGVPTFIRRIRYADFGAALRKIVKTNVMAGTCGMACPKGMLCEDACVLRPTGRPIAIRDLQLSAHLFGFGQLAGLRPRPGAVKVAVIGGGPAGLACAYYLTDLGVGVTLFEKAEVLGGMLTRGIPEYRLEGDVVRREIAFATHDVDVVTGILDRDLTRAKLWDQGFAAAFLATGLWKSNPPKLPGCGLEGVVDGSALLAELARGDKSYLKTKGKVAVVGGGNTACDVAVYLRRYTDCEVTVFYRRTREEMPAFAHEFEEALLGGVKFEFLAAPVAVEGKQRVEALVLARTRLGEPDADGRKRPVEIPGSELKFPCDHVIFATGGALDKEWLEGAFGIDVDKTGRPAVSPDTFMTRVEGVFAGGDLMREKGLVVQAVSDGRRAATAIAKYLGEKTT
jgi:NADPH-dependent glutamate synthase beta subunit-like oxidoreductase